jgi:membrane-associated phospholipid phosphatase
MAFLFDPELNLFLQSFQTAWLTTLMLVISALGSSVFLTAAAGFLLFRHDVKKGLLMLQLLLWSSLLTDFIKSLLGLPRPTDVHPSVSLLEEQYPQWLLEIFPLRMNFGFPSGHVCSTTVFWGAVMFLFPGRFQRIAGALFLSFMPLSRMYLGRHFLGDVVGGFILGVMILLIGKLILLRAFRTFVETRNGFSPFETISSFLFCFYLFVLPLLLFFVPHFETIDVGKLFGVNMSFLYLLLYGFPEERQDSRAGITRLAFGTILYVSMKLLFLITVSAPANPWFDALAGALPAFVSIWATIEISRKTGLYRRNT